MKTFVIIFLSLAVVICNGFSNTPITDEKTKRFESITLNGEVRDSKFRLMRELVRPSQDRLCLVLFGDPKEQKVKTARANATKTLKDMARQGHNMVLLHVDTSFYVKSPAKVLRDEDDVFVSPSFLVYVDGLQMSYHSVISKEEIRHIESAMILYEPEFMGWLDKALEDSSN